MDTKILEYIIAIADQKSISKAAELFYLSQPVMSRHLKNVEQDLDARLFYREHNEMRLTDAGKVFINSARAILHTEQQLTQELAGLRRDRKKTIRVMVDGYLLQYFNRYIVSAFQQEVPEFELEVATGTYNVAREALQEDLADLAVVKSSRIENKELSLWVLYQDEIVMAVPSEWAEAQPAEKEPKRGPLAFQDRCFIMERSDNVMRQEEQHIMNEYHFKPRLVYEVSGSATALQMVQKGHGVAFLPLALAASCPDGVVACPLEPKVVFNLYAATAAQHTMNEAEKALLNILKKEYGGWAAYMRRIAENT